MAGHEDHRLRMRERFCKHGLDGFFDHEVLELILQYSIPRRDTNLLAHRLMERFGSFSAVLEAPVNELCKVQGVGEYSATLLHLLVETSRRYAIDKYNLENPEKCLQSTSEFGAFMRPYFVGKTYEIVMLACLDNLGRVVCCEQIGGGTVGEVSISTRKIAEIALARNAHSVLLAHNHPGGSAAPSKADIDTTRQIQAGLDAIQIRLLDHIVIGELTDIGEPLLKDYVSMLESKLLY